jgi:hypothetical protein
MQALLLKRRRGIITRRTAEGYNVLEFPEGHLPRGV